jgi:putative polysaccharide biosynthesis protein
MYPNTAAYEKGRKANWYINQADGWGNRAKKSHTYIVYMNGTVAKVGHNAKVRPGCEIIVPSKPERTGNSFAQWLSIGTSVASIATMISTMTNLIK